MPDRVKSFFEVYTENKHRSFRCDYESINSLSIQVRRVKTWSAVRLYLVKSQFKICGVYSKK